MKPEEQNIAIHEARGMCSHPFDQWESWSIEDGNDYDSGITCKKCGEDISDNRVLRYFSDLNAMHEAEKYILKLSDGEPMPDIFERYAQKLLVVKYRSGGNLLKLGSNVLHASAAEKSEAFLRTLNLWKE